MNQKTDEKLKKVILYSFIGVVSVGLICAFIVGFAFRFDESLSGIVSLGASPQDLQYAFWEGAKKGGLYGGLVGVFFGCLFGLSVAMFGEKVK